MPPGAGWISGHPSPYTRERPLPRKGKGPPVRDVGVPRGLAAPGAALAPALPTYGSLTLTLALGARLLVEPALPELGIEPGPLDLTLEATERPLEALVFLDRYFQGDHRPGLVEQTTKLYNLKRAAEERQPV